MWGSGFSDAFRSMMRYIHATAFDDLAAALDKMSGV